MKITVEFDNGESSVFEFKKGAIKTVPFFWDCNCEKNFIQHKGKRKCVQCGAEHNKCPDSRLEEVICMLASKT